MQGVEQTITLLAIGGGQPGQAGQRGVRVGRRGEGAEQLSSSARRPLASPPVISRWAACASANPSEASRPARVIPREVLTSAP